ncbi:MAG: cobalt-precorrin-5B (C(1))-methyltransferase CbiD, partial [Nitrospinota bacterium]
GVGIVTKPGLPVPPGMPAINPTPMAMIKRAVGEVLKSVPGAMEGMALEVEVRVPSGLRLAAATANPRLGILGGLSILGTTGILKPVSTPAWQGTIACALDVARACGLREVILCPGRESESFARKELKAPEEAVILMGDHVAFSLEACRERRFEKIVVVGRLGKLSKMAAGELRTHMGDSSVDFELLSRWVREAGAPEKMALRVAHANTAREVGETLKGSARERFFQRVAEGARESLVQKLGPGAELSVLLLSPRGELLARAEGAWGRGHCPRYLSWE